MSGEQLAYLAVLLPLAALHVAAVIVAHRDHLRRYAALRRMRPPRVRPRQRHISKLPPQRPIGFLAELAMRDSSPPPSALAHVHRSSDAPAIHYVSPTEDTRGLVRTRCRPREKR